ncbi:phage holin family protein [Bradyrhizobium centrosematis]|uniref:phage holin family protein n=1 Tax=Bradyrhizobium centrosematis TaxID=1300039 RepID=UPI002167EB12|nr:phage holin family protein [Bradyrhizobium centrosematis]MCS3763060.1 putative membrane protein YqjE [Bradyrhizobium centrosematis]MCS3775727.1 putative membrane protein YqjE [Bradyrhizobium centrosematis]
MSIEHDIETGKNDLHNVSALVSDAMAQVAKLVQNEVDLAKAELGEKAQKLGGALGLLAGGAVLVIPAIVMALFALSSALISAGWSPTLAYLVSAIVGAAISGALIAVGINRLDMSNLAPKETIRQLGKDKDTVKGMVR